jgi:hypothetical protein
MQMMEPMAARAPWMGSVGNHEAANGFSEWRARFSYYNSVAKRSGSDDQMFYSYNHGLVHYVHVSTETAIPAAWLESDLKSVDRSVTPWVIAVGHKEKWMQLGTVDFKTYDALFRAYGVDLYVTGHQHKCADSLRERRCRFLTSLLCSYQRVRPRDASNQPLNCASADGSTYTNCGSYVTLVVGSPGNKEQTGVLGAFDRFEHAGENLMDAFTINQGWSLMTVHNSTTLSFVYKVTGERDPTPRVGDWDAWKMVKTN